MRFRKRFVIPAVLFLLLALGLGWFSFNYNPDGYPNTWPNSWLCQPQKVLAQGPLSLYIFPEMTNDHPGEVQLIEGSCLFHQKWWWAKATFGGIGVADPSMVEMCQQLTRDGTDCAYNMDQQPQSNAGCTAQGDQTTECSGRIGPLPKKGRYYFSVKIAPKFGVELSSDGTVTVP